MTKVFGSFRELWLELGLLGVFDHLLIRLSIASNPKETSTIPWRRGTTNESFFSLREIFFAILLGISGQMLFWPVLGFFAITTKENNNYINNQYLFCYH
jgi:hypothetical protein